MKQKRLNIIAVLAFIIGIGCLAYPFVSNYLNQKELSKISDNQSQVVQKIAKERPHALDEEKEKSISYNESLRQGKTIITDPFDPSSVKDIAKEYDQRLNIADDSIMATLFIPCIGVKMPVYHGTSDEVLQKGIGHLATTSLPIGGESTHSVLSGHTGLPSIQILDNLEKVKIGDYFIIRVLGEDHAYEVYDIDTVLPTETDSLTIQPDQDLCTLVTCTPYGVNSHRLLVHAKRIDVPQDWLDRNAKDPENPVSVNGPSVWDMLHRSYKIGIIVALAFILGLVVILFIRNKRKEANTLNKKALPKTNVSRRPSTPRPGKKPHKPGHFKK